MRRRDSNRASALSIVTILQLRRIIAAIFPWRNCIRLLSMTRFLRIWGSSYPYRGFSMRKCALADTSFFALAGQAAAADLRSQKDETIFAPARAPNDWRFEATINGWMPSVFVNTAFANRPSASADVGFFKLLT